MKIIPYFILISYSSLSYADKINTQLHKNIAAFIPQHWEIISQAQGDLNQDGQTDTAIIIQPKNLNNHERKLLIFFKHNNSLQQKIVKPIPDWSYRDEENCMDDALSGGGVEIKHGILDLSFHDMNTCSNWYGRAWTYRFKWQNSHFKLTGFEYWFVNKTDGKATRHSGNFLTQKMTTTLYNEFDDAIKPKISWKKLSPISPNTLDKIQLEPSESFLKQLIK